MIKRNDDDLAAASVQEARMAGKRARGCSTQISAVQRLSTRARWPVSVGGFACARRREMPRTLRAAQENPAEAFASEALASA
jgi:hypothetical protein